MPRSWSISALGRGLPSGLVRATTSVLMASATTSCSTSARHRQKRGDDVEPIGRQHRDPSPRGAGQKHEADGDHPGTDEHVDAPLRAQQRHGVDQLAEHHLYGPGQREPHRQRGQLGRCPGQALLDPESLGDGGEPHGAVGEIDHQQRQIFAAHGAHRRQQRALDLRSSNSRPALGLRHPSIASRLPRGFGEHAGPIAPRQANCSRSSTGGRLADARRELGTTRLVLRFSSQYRASIPSIGRSQRNGEPP